MGYGRWRGRLGAVREFELLAGGGVSVEGDGHRHRPWGLDGGAEGLPSDIVADLGRGGARAGVENAVPADAAGRPLPLRRSERRRQRPVRRAGAGGGASGRRSTPRPRPALAPR
jgi:N-methylhydantoinase B/oxoprolinase/acetone carboxylase alpha subunit